MLINYEAIVNKLSSQMDNKVLRGELIASNVANLDTPGYKGRDIKFEDQLKSEIGDLAMKTSHPRHISSLAPLGDTNEVVEDDSPGRPDGNNVNVDDEMLKMSKNNIEYNIAIQLMTKRFGHFKTAIERSK